MLRAPPRPLRLRKALPPKIPRLPSLCCTKRALLLSSMTLGAAAGPAGPDGAIASSVATCGDPHASSCQAAADAGATSQVPAAKTVYLIRHGEGWHNIGFETNLDPHLTPRGWRQTAALQQHLAALKDTLQVELVVVSPLRRTLETAAGVFGALAAPVSTTAARQAAAAVASPGVASWLLMRPQLAQPQLVTSAATRFLPVARAPGTGVGGGGASAGGPTPLKLLAHEGCRERIGPNVCDRFRDLSDQVADFPGVDFSEIAHERDVHWERLSKAPCNDGGVYRTGEEEAATEERALRFYHWLLSRPESSIAVVSHCGFLVHGMRALGRGMLNTWSSAMLQAATRKQQLADNGDGAGNGADSVLMFDGAVAEALRATAGDVGGRMAIDWQNCEMRSIILQRGPDWLTSTAGVGAVGAGGAQQQQQQQWLWATPGGASTWFPGGLCGV